MTSPPATNGHALRHNTPIRAVLFDLSGTLLDERYAHHGIAHLAAALHERFAVDPTLTRNGFMEAFRTVSHEYASRRFYLMRDVICEALKRLLNSCGHQATRNELIHLERLFWTAAVPTATLADGAIETLTLLRDAGIRTAIVSYADIPVFEALLKQTGLAGSTDVEVCSEVARSCKPHAEIFHRALRTIGVEPSDAMFVGDSVADDIVGGNRIGMRTTLLSPGEFTLGDRSNDDPETRPDHHVDGLLDIVDLVIRVNETIRRRNGPGSGPRRRASRWRHEPTLAPPSKQEPDRDHTAPVGHLLLGQPAQAGCADRAAIEPTSRLAKEAPA
jgi:HAD superfamily hydrolase (TIGR01509 family)